MSDDRPLSCCFTLVLLLSYMWFAPSAWADFQAGRDAAILGDYPTAVSKLRPIAAQGDARAQSLLGVLYANGLGVPQDLVLARQWWEKAAAQGDADAQIGLGLLYSKGEGVPQDYVQARQWYEKAAAQGKAIAQISLGTLYAYGYGTPKDYQQAARWFRFAADQGDALAQMKLGVMYERGDGVSQDIVEAYKWYTLAEANGENDSDVQQRLLAKRMTPAQIAEARKLARDWRPGSK